MSMKLLSLFVITLFFIGTTHAFYESNKNVVQLNAKNFDSLVFGDSFPWIIEFYAPWCGHCQRLVPEYEKASESLKGLVKVGAVNCDEDQNKSICGRFGVKGFPTIKLFSYADVDSKGKYPKAPKDYQGDRTARSLYSSAVSELPNLVVKLTSGSSAKKTVNIDEFIADSIPKAILFTTKSETTPLYKSLAVEFKNRMKLSEVRDTEKAILEKYSVTKFPTLIAISADGEQHQFEGNINIAELSKFLSFYALPGNQKNENSNEKEEEKKEKFNPEVVKITSQELLNQECLEKGFGTCLLAFMTSNEDNQVELQEQLAVLKQVKKVAHEKNNGFRVMWLVANEQEQLMQKFGLSDQTPSLMALSPRRKKFRPFLGGYDLSAITSFMDECFQGKGRYFTYDFDPIIA